MPNADSLRTNYKTGDASFAAQLSTMPDSFLVKQAREYPGVFSYLVACSQPFFNKIMQLYLSDAPLASSFKPGELPKSFLVAAAKANPDRMLALLLGGDGRLGASEKSAVVVALSAFDPNAVLLKKWAPKLDNDILRRLICPKGMPKGTFMYVKVLLGAVEMPPELQIFAIKTHGARVASYIANPSPKALAISQNLAAELKYAQVISKYSGTTAIPFGKSFHKLDARPFLADLLKNVSNGVKEDKKTDLKGFEMDGLESCLFKSFISESGRQPGRAWLDAAALGGQLLEAIMSRNSNPALSFTRLPEQVCESACLAAIKAGDSQLPAIAGLFTPRLGKAYNAHLRRKALEKTSESPAKAQEKTAEPAPNPAAEKAKRDMVDATARIAAIHKKILTGQVQARKNA